jgi:hypothetical protein
MGSLPYNQRSLKKKRRLLTIIHALLIPAVFNGTAFFAAARGFDDVFPRLDSSIKQQALSQTGYYFYSKMEQTGTYHFSIDAGSIPDTIISEIIKNHPETLIEMLIVIDAPDNKKLTLLDIYNALGKTSALAGRNYYSHVRKKYTPLFKKVSRVENEKNQRKINDPIQKNIIPAQEDIFFAVDDVNFGECFYKSTFSATLNGITYKLTNIKNISLFVLTVIKAHSLNINFYIEPVNEGVLIYALMGISMERIAASKVDVPSAARKRFDIVKQWLIDGITGKI